MTEDRQTEAALFRSLPECKQDVSQYALTAEQWRLINGYRNPRRPSPERTRIREDKIQKFPDLFENLFEDTATLYENDVFADGLGDKDLDWDEIYKQLINVDKHTRRSRGPIGIPAPQVMDGGNMRRHLHFGEELGRMVQQLAESADETHLRKVLHGFFVGLFVSPPDQQQNPNQHLSQQKEKLLEELDVLQDFVVTLERTIDNLSEYRRGYRGNLNEPIEMIIEVLKECKITPTETSFEYLYREVDPATALAGVSEKIREEEREDAKEIIATVKGQTKISGIEELSEQVRSDINELDDEKKDKQPGKKIIKQAFEFDGPFRLRDLELTNKRGATYLLKKFCGNEDALHPVTADETPWTERPLLENAPNDKYKLTDYAELLCEIESKESETLTEYANYTWVDITETLQQFVLNEDALSDKEKQLIESGLTTIN